MRKGSDLKSAIQSVLFSLLEKTLQRERKSVEKKIAHILIPVGTH